MRSTQYPCLRNCFRHFGPGGALAALLLLGIPATTATTAETLAFSACRDAADFPLEGRGVAWEQLDAASAIALCHEALATEAGDPAALLAFLGRAYRKAERYGDARTVSERAADAGVLAGMVNLGLLYRDGLGVLKDYAEAVRWLRKAADQGHAHAQDNLGWMYEHGRGVAQDDVEAVRWYRRAAEQGHAISQNNLGWMYEHGRGVAQDDVEAVRWYRRAAEQRDPSAQFNLALMYANGRGVAQDDAEAVRWYRMAAEQGDASAQNNLGQMYYDGRGVTQDDAEAVRWYRMAAEQGRASAQNNLGRMYEQGRGMAREDAEAVRWYRRAADQGHAGAQDNLGWMYANGRGVAQDDAEAVRWYRMAAEQGNAGAQDNLGRMYEQGRGVAQDDAEAVRWYRRAAEQGHASGQFNLAGMYEHGRGVEQDDAEAVRWYRMAAEQGDASAQNNLGGMYDNGRGVAEGDAEAASWYRRAADQGHASAQNNLGRMYANGRGVAQDHAEAVRWYRMAAEQGHAIAQTNLGWMYGHGLGVPQDLKEALRLYGLALDSDPALGAQGMVEFLTKAELFGASIDFAEQFLTSKGYTSLPEDKKAEFLRFLDKKVEEISRLPGKRDLEELVSLAYLGVPAAAYCVGLYHQSLGAPEDNAEARRWYRRAAQQGNASAQFNLGLMYYDGDGVVQDEDEAVRWYRMAAEQGDASAQNSLGWVYEHGRGVEQDEDEAVRWYRMAAEQGHASAQNSLGGMYYDGRGVAQDDAEAVRWYRRAAEQGDASAQSNLGRMYANGRGVAQDNAEAMRRYRMAAEPEEAEASVGLILVGSRGPARDAMRGWSLIERAAKRGANTAQYALGERFRRGLNTEVDLERALEQYWRAAEGGILEAWLSIVEVQLLHDDGDALATLQRFLDRYANGRINGGFIAPEVMPALRAAAESRQLDRVARALEAFQRARDRSGWIITDFSSWVVAPQAEATAGVRAPQGAGSAAAQAAEGESEYKRHVQRLIAEQLQRIRQKEARLEFDRELREIYESLADLHEFGGDLDRALHDRLAAVRYRVIGAVLALGGSDNYFVLLEESCTLGELSRWAHERGRPGAALLFAKLSVNRLEEARRYLEGLDDDLRECFLEVHEDRYRWLADLFIEQGRLAEAENVLGMLKDFEAYEYVRRDTAAKGRSYERMPLSEPEAEIEEAFLSAGRSLAGLAREFEALVSKRRVDGLAEAEVAAFDRIRVRLREAQAEFTNQLDALREEVAGLDTATQAAVASRNLDGVKSIRGTLRDAFGGDVIALHSVVLPGRTHIMLTTPRVQLVRTASVPAKELASMVLALREATQDPRRDPVPAGRALYDLLLRPIEAELEGARAKTLLLSLDGVLRYLPFAALHDGERFLAERYELVLFTAATWDQLLDSPRSEWRVAGFGVSEGIGDLVPLPNVAAELEGIVLGDDGRGVLDGRVWLDGTFTKEELVGALFDGYPVIHLATHFVLEPGKETDSYLLLGDRDRLTIAEVRENDFDFDFGDVQLLTLSACETAVPARGADGSEIESFGVLAQRQGARAVIATLWPVADASTALFMQRFYEVWTRMPGIGKANALQLVQKEFIANEKAGEEIALLSRRGCMDCIEGISDVTSHSPGYIHPYYWAPFVLMGNWM
jgi:TPR repeat protein/CHAT domain-containing protein